MTTQRPIFLALAPVFIVAGLACPVNAAVATFFLDNVFFTSGQQMTGQFDWTYTPGDFANGTGVFTSIDVPHTAHGLNDLVITVETTQIEISLAGNFHDDGVDVFMVLQQPFSLGAPAPLDLDPAQSRYDIGGNGFITGGFLSGQITPVPEPAAMALLGVGGLLIACRRR